MRQKSVIGYILTYSNSKILYCSDRIRLGRDRMVVGSIYNYLCNQCLSLMLWVWISIRAMCTTLCDQVCLWLATGRWFSPGPRVSSTNKTVRHHKTEILLKIKVITKLPNSEQSYKGKVQTHNYINRQNQSTTGKLWKP